MTSLPIAPKPALVFVTHPDHVIVTGAACAAGAKTKNAGNA
jgi:hypothetical protein